MDMRVRGCGKYNSDIGIDMICYSEVRNECGKNKKKIKSYKKNMFTGPRTIEPASFYCRYATCIVQYKLWLMA